jgi:hypothetical protein
MNEPSADTTISVLLSETNETIEGASTTFDHQAKDHSEEK